MKPFMKAPPNDESDLDASIQEGLATSFTESYIRRTTIIIVQLSPTAKILLSDPNVVLVPFSSQLEENMVGAGWSGTLIR